MQKSRSLAFKFSLLFTLSITIIGAIPLYFYATLALKYTQLRERSELAAYAQQLSEKISAIKDGTTRFTYPRSIIFRSAILDENGEVIFSLLESIPELEIGEILHKKRELFYRINLPQNRLAAHSLIVSKQFSYNALLREFLILLSVVLLLIFASSFWLLRRLIEPFEEANRSMDRIFKDVLHELRTPLGIVQLNLEILEEKFGAHRAFKRSSAALKVFKKLFEDIEFGIRHKKMNAPLATTHFSLLLEESLDSFHIIAKSKNIAFESEITPNIWLTIHPSELQRIIDNNLSNAIKYSPPETKITVKLVKNRNGATFEVQDEGIGISDTRAIFGRYYRGDEIRGGFGIGLSIVKRICDKHKIKIEVHSNLNFGSRFLYHFPTLVSA